jgi:chemotaxis protein CheZ
MSAVRAANDSEDLQALFESIAASSSGAAPVEVHAQQAPKHCGNDDGVDATQLLAKIGQLTRTLHESLRKLGYDRAVEEAASTIPDARERLAYVATLTERAAQRVLNANDIARPIQDELGASAAALAGRWRKVFAAQAGVEEFKALSESTLAFLDQVPTRTRATTDQLMEIMMAQDFQDLTGQVIKRINELVHNLEGQLLLLLLENTPAEQRRPGNDSLINGPSVNPGQVGKVAHSQRQVDDLLESLGF